MAAWWRPHRVVVVVFEGLQGRDLGGPLEGFADANDGLGRAAYELTVAAVEPGQVRTSSGLGVVADVALADVRGKVDTLVVVGGAGTYQVYTDEEMNSPVRRLPRQPRRLPSVCSGAFVRSTAGLLNVPHASPTQHVLL